MLAPARNIPLATACAADGRPKYLIAALAQMTPNLLSAFISGRRQPTTEQAERLAGVLGVPVENLRGAA